jgi:hypothetical protein
VELEELTDWPESYVDPDYEPTAPVALPADFLAALAALTAEVAALRSGRASVESPAPRPEPPAAPAPLLCTIPEASKIVGIGVDTLRAWVASGRLPRRTKGAGSKPKRATFLVNVDEIRAAAEGKGGASLVGCAGIRCQP